MRGGRKTVSPNAGISVFMNSHAASSDSFLELQEDTNMWFACRVESWVMPIGTVGEGARSEVIAYGDAVDGASDGDEG